MSRNLSSPDQTDLFERDVFETRQPTADLDFDRFRSRMKRGMAAAITARGVDRGTIASAISEMPGIGALSRSMLDAYTSEAKPHDISLVRFKALVREIDAPQLWDLAVRDDGLLVLQGDEARLAEIARLQQQSKVLARKLRQLQAIPVQIRSR